jgi:hypothetical protein
MGESYFPTLATLACVFPTCYFWMFCCSFFGICMRQIITDRTERGAGDGRAMNVHRAEMPLSRRM